MQRGATILVDCEPGAESFERDLLGRLGHEVTVCHGPAASGELCPIMQRDGHCDLLDQARGIVFELDLENPKYRAILRRYSTIVDDDVPIYAIVDPIEFERHRELYERVEVWNGPPTAAEIDGFAAEVEAVERINITLSK